MLDEASGSIAAAHARRFLDRHGIARHKQAGLFAQIIEVSFSQAARKLKGAVGISLEELTALAYYFGSSLNEVLAADDLVEPVVAVWKFQTRTLRCLLWTRGIVETRSEATLIARKTDAGWVIDWAPYPQLNADCIRIDKLLIHPAT